MRIAHIYPWFIPEMGYEENFLPNAQAELGNEVWILTSDRLPSKDKLSKPRFSPGVFEDGLVHVKRLRSKPVGGWTQVYLLRLWDSLRDIRPNVVHTHGLWAIHTLQVVKRFGPFKLIADDHTDNGNMPTDLSAQARFGIARWVCKRILRSGGKIVSVNPFSFWFVTKCLGISEEKVMLLPLGINTRTFFQDFHLRTLGREKLIVAKEAIVFVTSGRLTPGKGFELLLSAFAGVSRKHSSSRLLIIGSGNHDYEHRLTDRISTLGLEGAVILLPWMSQNELCLYYNAADVGILPGKLGGIKEILAVGRPLVAPDNLATSYLIESGNGLAFQPDDEIGLMQIMLRYIEEPQLRQQHGEKSVHVAKNQLSWEAVARKSLNLYSFNE